MRPTLRPWLTDGGGPRLGPPLAWAIAAAAIVSVFAVVVMIVNYERLNSTTATQIKAELPSANYGAVAALIRASGRECLRVCTIAPSSALSLDTTLEVECATATAPDACSMPTHYRVSVTESPAGPQR